MIGFYNYTVYLTYFSLIVSGVGLYQAANGRPLVAIFCLMVSGLCDMFDGKIARTRHKSGYCVLWRPACRHRQELFR